MDTLEGYAPLEGVLRDAYEQASAGKGSVRHALEGQPWLQQQWTQLADTYGDGFLLGQATKKTNESQGMDDTAAYHELLGAINYLAMAAYRRKAEIETAATSTIWACNIYRNTNEDD
tara:strand:+ start:1390 stop:1740 length:351 start_codon:yes stop_codon:yes gene_type:complete